MKRIIKILILSSLVSSCDYMGKTSQSESAVDTELARENESLKAQLKRVKEEQMEEQKAIFEFIQLYDSINYSIGRMQREFLNIQMEGNEVGIDQKKRMLSDMQMIEESIGRDRNRITQLERQLEKIKANSISRTVIDQYKIRLAEKEQEVNELNSNIVRLTLQLEEAENTINQQSNTISQQREVIDEQTETVARHVAELNRKYILLVSKNEFFLQPYHGNMIFLDYSRNRVSILNDADNLCRVESRADGGVNVSIDQDFWEDSKYLVIYVGRKL